MLNGLMMVSEILEPEGDCPLTPIPERAESTNNLATSIEVAGKAACRGPPEPPVSL